MPIIHTSRLDLCYEQEGASDKPAVLLLHGLGCQLVQWPGSLIAGLVAAGFRVLRMDNRDVGLSQKLDELGSVDLMALAGALIGGEPPAPPYTLRDMADDTVALCDALGIERVHIVGVSMGGMIAQRIALHHAERVSSLTCIISSSGAAGLPASDPAAVRSITAVPRSSTRADVIAQLEQSWDLIGGPHFKSTEAGIGRLTAAAYDRSRHPPGFLRQMAAVAADTDRAEGLARIRARTLVIHGAVDPLVPLACGEDTARRIPGAQFKVFALMGHDLPEPLMPQILQVLVAHLRSSTGT
jgi:pimeloyl-ACP methyl ester carboxylesterase